MSAVPNGHTYEMCHNNDRSDILNAINENGSNNRIMDQNNLINKNIYDSSLATQLQVAKNGSDIEKGFSENRASNLVDGGFTRQTQADSARDISNAVERNGGDTRLSISQHGSDVKSTVVDSRGIVSDNINRGVNQLLDVMNTASGDIKYGALANSVDIKNSVNMGFQAVNKSIDDNKYESLKNSFELSKQMNVGFCETKYEALKNAMNASKELAECCCELKGKIEHTAKETQDAVYNIENNRLRDNLLVARDEINLLRFSRHRERSRSPERRRSSSRS